MAAGVPIVSSTRSYIPEAIRHGVDGYLYDPTDIESLVATSLRLLSDPEDRKRIGDNVRSRAGEHFTPERAAEGYERIIREAYWRREQLRGAVAPTPRPSGAAYR